MDERLEKLIDWAFKLDIKDPNYDPEETFETYKKEWPENVTNEKFGMPSEPKNWIAVLKTWQLAGIIEIKDEDSGPYYIYTEEALAGHGTS